MLLVVAALKATLRDRLRDRTVRVWVRDERDPARTAPTTTPRSSGRKSGGTHRTARPGWRCYPVAPAQATRRQASSSSRESLISKEAYRGRLQPAFSGLTNWLTRSLKLRSRHTGPPGTAPRARASYRTPKRRAPRYCQGLSVRLKGVDYVDTATGHRSTLSSPLNLASGRRARPLPGMRLVLTSSSPLSISC